MKNLRALLPALLSLLFAGAVAYAAGTTVIGTNIQINNKVGTTSYTFLCTPPDAGKLVKFGASASTAVTLPWAGHTCFSSGWYAYIANQGTGTVTVTPATSTIASASSITVPTGSTYQIISDGTNYLLMR